METTYFTFCAHELAASEAEAACGEGRRRLVFVRPAPEKGRGKVIDLAGWRACHPAPALPPEEDEGDRAPARPRRSLGEFLRQGSELLATLAVAGVLAALVLRLLGL